ncbi:hypothetical protein D7294_05000 [Streptomyces hoynatensis]|uniref:Uncharacterized protein n=1 Tax=Streptomyces hoynatensis TaxID=1141874 RepID=A0A3A9ZBZ5_9ACTN|nr:hypothetical protein D7294_05000 [Streptomyces hoynatensis]
MDGRARARGLGRSPHGRGGSRKYPADAPAQTLTSWPCLLPPSPPGVLPPPPPSVLPPPPPGVLPPPPAPRRRRAPCRPSRPPAGPRAAPVRPAPGPRDLRHSTGERAFAGGRGRGRTLACRPTAGPSRTRGLRDTEGHAGTVAGAGATPAGAPAACARSPARPLGGCRAGGAGEER